MRSLSLLLVAAVVLAAATAGVSGASLAPVASMPSLASGDAAVASVAAHPTATTAKRRRRNCDPNYRGRCLRRNVRDYDCAGGSGDGPRYVRGPFRVVGRDRFGLDSDGDGIACES